VGTVNISGSTGKNIAGINVFGNWTFQQQNVRIQGNSVVFNLGAATDVGAVYGIYGIMGYDGGARTTATVFTVSGNTITRAERGIAVQLMIDRKGTNNTGKMLTNIQLASGAISGNTVRERRSPSNSPVCADYVLSYWGYLNVTDWTTVKVDTDFPGNFGTASGKVETFPENAKTFVNGISDGSVIIADLALTTPLVQKITKVSGTVTESKYRAADGLAWPDALLY
jgi:hypothetical protein